MLRVLTQLRSYALVVFVSEEPPSHAAKVGYLEQRYQGLV